MGWRHKDGVSCKTVSDLSSRVYKKLLEVPRGKVTTYAELAKAVGIENGQRAIGNIMKTLTLF